MYKKKNQEEKKDQKTKGRDIHLNKGVEIMISTNRKEEEPAEKQENSEFSFRQTITLFSRRFTVLFEIDKIEE